MCVGGGGGGGGLTVIRPHQTPFILYKLSGHLKKKEKKMVEYYTSTGASEQACARARKRDS